MKKTLIFAYSLLSTALCYNVEVHSEESIFILPTDPLSALTPSKLKTVEIEDVETSPQTTSPEALEPIKEEANIKGTLNVTSQQPTIEKQTVPIKVKKKTTKSTQANTEILVPVTVKSTELEETLETHTIQVNTTVPGEVSDQTSSVSVKAVVDSENNVVFTGEDKADANSDKLVTVTGTLDITSPQQTTKQETQEIEVFIPSVKTKTVDKEILVPVNVPVTELTTTEEIVTAETTTNVPAGTSTQTQSVTVEASVNPLKEGVKTEGSAPTDTDSSSTSEDSSPSTSEDSSSSTSEDSSSSTSEDSSSSSTSEDSASISNLEENTTSETDEE